MGKVILHPFFYAVYLALFYYAFPEDRVPADILLFNALILVSISLLLWLCIALFTNNLIKSGVFITIYLIVFFNFKFIHQCLLTIFSSKISSQTVYYLSLLLLGTFFTGFVYMIKDFRDSLKFIKISKILNIYTGILLAACLLKIGINHYYQKNLIIVLKPSLTDKMVTNRKLNEHNLPNIYYIVLDEYARSDVIQKRFGHNNAEFINYLKNTGFFLAEKSCSNYIQTSLSIASSLNFRYLNEFGDILGQNSRNRMPIYHMIRHNETTKFLKNYKYQFITFPSGYFATEIKSSDKYPNKINFLDNFQNSLLNFTPIPMLLKQVGLHFQYDCHRERILFTFEQLKEIASGKQPFFAFAHILAVHHPYVFGESGEAINPDLEYDIWEHTLVNQDGFTLKDYNESYVNQLKFINNKLQETIEAIKSKTSRPIIIILQGDHGSGILLKGQVPDSEFMKERTYILNAYYFYDKNYSKLYHEITPVNTFRLIFNQYFLEKINLLPNESFFSSWNEPYKFFKIYP